MSHCCELMNLFLNDARINIFYDEVTREYYIKIDGGNSIQCLFYCPWCGKKLPISLRDVYYGILDEKFGEDRDFYRENVPIEFSTSSWWKNIETDLNMLIEKYNYDSETGIPGRCLLLRKNIRNNCDQS
jgi:hypothetical protein